MQNKMNKILTKEENFVILHKHQPNLAFCENLTTRNASSPSHIRSSVAISVAIAIIFQIIHCCFNSTFAHFKYFHKYVINLMYN